MTALPVPEAARALGERPGTIQRWIRQGCPTVRRGRRGRGRSTLVDPDAVLAWRELQARRCDQQVLLDLAEQLPRVIVPAMLDAWNSGPHYRALTAGMLAGAWYAASCAIRDHLREQCPLVPELSEVPEEIERLRKIAQKPAIL